MKHYALPLLCLILACALMAASPALAGEPAGECEPAGLESTTESVAVSGMNDGWFQALTLMPWHIAPAEVVPVPTECKFADIECTAEWAPVTCKKGGWFQNRCLAKQACAKGCRNFFGG